jgi:hypothetical protein
MKSKLHKVPKGWKISKTPTGTSWNSEIGIHDLDLNGQTCSDGPCVHVRRVRRKPVKSLGQVARKMKTHTFTLRVATAENRDAAYWNLLGMMAARKPDGLELKLLKQAKGRFCK